MMRLPAIIGELRAAPESLVSTFKLYRNLDALYDVSDRSWNPRARLDPKMNFSNWPMI